MRPIYDYFVKERIAKWLASISRRFARRRVYALANKLSLMEDLVQQEFHEAHIYSSIFREVISGILVGCLTLLCFCAHLSLLIYTQIAAGFVLSALEKRLLLGVSVLFLLVGCYFVRRVGEHFVAAGLAARVLSPVNRMKVVQEIKSEYKELRTKFELSDVLPDIKTPSDAS